ncbi:MAG: RHS repeat protein, partial [Chloroflexi bacterium]|nr:RHS repeat protein [Chloroflexota bacterium]
ISQTYDLVGNRSHITYPDGKVVTSTFDGDRRLLTVTAWDGGITSYDYDSIGRMITMTLPNGIQSSALYNRANRLTQISHTAPGNLLLGQYQYQLDGNGLAEIVTETLRSPSIADLNGRFLESSGQVVMEAENGISTAGSSHAWQSQTVQSGYGGDSYLRTLPDIGDLDSVADLADSPHLEFPLQISTPASYTVWVRGMAPDAGGDSLHIGLDGSVMASAD